MTDRLRLDDYLYILYVLVESKDNDVLKRLCKLVEVKLQSYSDGPIAERLREMQSELNTIFAKNVQGSR